MENSETIDEAKLIAVVEDLAVAPEAIKNFSEEGARNYFNNIHDNDFTNSNGVLAQRLALMRQKLTVSKKMNERTKDN